MDLADHSFFREEIFCFSFFPHCLVDWDRIDIRAVKKLQDFLGVKVWHLLHETAHAVDYIGVVGQVVDLARKNDSLSVLDFYFHRRSSC